MLMVVERVVLAGEVRRVLRKRAVTLGGYTFFYLTHASLRAAPFARDCPVRDDSMGIYRIP